MKRRKSIIAAMLCVSLLSTACAASGSDEGTAGKDAGAQQTSEAPLLIGAISQAFDIRIAYMLIGILGGCIVLIVSFSSAFDIQESGDKPE